MEYMKKKQGIQKTEEIEENKNFYKLDKTQHGKLLRESITTTKNKNRTDAADIIDSQTKHDLSPKSSTSTAAQNKSQNNKPLVP